MSRVLSTKYSHDYGENIRGKINKADVGKKLVRKTSQASSWDHHCPLAPHPPELRAAGPKLQNPIPLPTPLPSKASFLKSSKMCP